MIVKPNCNKLSIIYDIISLILLTVEEDDAAIVKVECYAIILTTDDMSPEGAGSSALLNMEQHENTF